MGGLLESESGELNQLADNESFLTLPPIPKDWQHGID